MSLRRLLMAGSVMALALASCTETPKPHEEPKPAPDTAGRVSRDLPSGRFQLPTRHTPVPDFYVTLPSGFTVKDLSRMPDDEYFFIRGDDPSIADSMAVTPGFMRFYVGVRAQTAIEKGVPFTERNVMIGGRPLVWKLWTEKLPGGGVYYQSETSSDDYFASLSPELAHAPLHLHIYVAGRDSAQVAALMTAARTITMTP